MIPINEANAKTTTSSINPYVLNRIIKKPVKSSGITKLKTLIIGSKKEGPNSINSIHNIGTVAAAVNIIDHVKPTPNVKSKAFSKLEPLFNPEVKLLTIMYPGNTIESIKTDNNNIKVNNLVKTLINNHLGIMKIHLNNQKIPYMIRPNIYEMPLITHLIALKTLCMLSGIS
jgi:hypothetical protein